MFCAALLELRNRIQAKQSEKNVEKNEYELAAETGEGDDLAADAKQRNDRADRDEQSAGVETGPSETDNEQSAGVETCPSETPGDELNNNTDTEVEMTADSFSRKSVSDADGLDELEQTEELDDNLTEAEQREPDTSDTSSAAVTPPTDAADVNQDEVHVDDIDVIDLSDMTLQSSSGTDRQHVTVCFEVRLQLTVFSNIELTI